MRPISKTAAYVRETAHSGSQKAVVGKAAVKQLLSCELPVSIMLARNAKQTHVTGRRLCIQCSVATRIDTTLYDATRATLQHIGISKIQHCCRIHTVLQQHSRTKSSMRAVIGSTNSLQDWHQT